MCDEMHSMVDLPVFNGERKNFVMWWVRFQAYYRVIGFNLALSRSVDIPSIEEESKMLSAVAE